MRKKLSLITAFLMLLSLSFAEEADDPAVVRVGSVTYTKSQVQSALQSDLDFSELVGGVYLTEEKKPNNGTQRSSAL